MLLLVLVRAFESRRGEILNLFSKIRKGQLLRVPSVGEHNSTRDSTREERAEIFSR